MEVGFHLTLTTNRPFGLQDTKIWEFDLPDGGTYKLYDDSDEIGYIYADMTITCLQAGTLKIQNSMDNRIVQITNCSQGEVITFTDVYLTIFAMLYQNILQSGRK